MKRRTSKTTPRLTSPGRDGLRAGKRSERRMRALRAGAIESSGAPTRARAFREAVRAGRRSAIARSQRLLEIENVGDLLDEMLLGALQLSRARRVEIELDSTGEQRSRESLRPSRISERNEKRLAIALRHKDEKLAMLRIIGPMPTALRALRAYAAAAARALAAALRAQHAAVGQARHEALVDSLVDTCLLTLDPESRVVELHGRAPRLHTPLHRALGQTLEALADTDDIALSRAEVRETLARARRDRRAEVRTTLKAPRERIDVQLLLVPVRASDQILCTVRDLTEVKSIENALLRRNHELSVAADRLKEVDMLKNEFMSNVSHELRTPLTAIIAYAEALLLTTPDEKTREEFLRVICEQGHKLQKLIGGLLDIAKLDSLATELKLELGSINQVVESAVVTVRPTADENHIGIVLELESDLPPVYLDELRSQQIVWNLLTNAIKFSPTHSTITVRSWTGNDQVWVSVRDEGPGIADEHQKLIFEKFVQVDGSSTRRHGGVGLGLDLVKHLVELHGGNLKLDSAVGCGSTFTFSIPIEKRRKPRFEPQRKRLSRTTEPT